MTNKQSVTLIGLAGLATILTLSGLVKFISPDCNHVAKQFIIFNRQSQKRPIDSIRNPRPSIVDADWFAIHNDKDEYGYVDKNGTMKIPFGKYSICYTDTFTTFAIVVNDQGFIGIDKKENVLFKIFPFDNGPDEVSEGLFRIVQGDSIGFANMQGQIVIKPKFTSVSMFSGPLAAYCKDCKTTKDGDHWSWTGGKWGFIDRNGDTAIEPIYDAVIVPFDPHRAKVRLKEKEFWIDEKGMKN